MAIAFGGFYGTSSGTNPSPEAPAAEELPSYTLASDPDAVAQLLHARTFQSAQEALASLRKRGYEIVKRG